MYDVAESVQATTHFSLRKKRVLFTSTIVWLVDSSYKETRISLILMILFELFVSSLISRSALENYLFSDKKLNFYRILDQVLL